LQIYSSDNCRTNRRTGLEAGWTIRSCHAGLALVLVLAETLRPGGDRVARGAGLALVAWGRRCCFHAAWQRFLRRGHMLKCQPLLHTV
jgi:hypothetical protein